MAKRNETFEEFLVRFWGNVSGVSNCEPDACWHWKKPHSHGYGRIYYKGKLLQAHRVAYERIKGSIPEGWEIDHLCRNPACVKPSHLEAVPSRVNTLRGIGPTAQNAKKQHCAKGHPYTPENTYPRKDGTRQCRICKRNVEKARQKKKRYRATLDATTPAPMGSNIREEDIGKSMMRRKGGDGE